MSKYIAPSHPLIHASLIQRFKEEASFLIVESEEYAEKLFLTLLALSEITPEHHKKPIIIRTYNDMLRVEHYGFIGICTTQVALNPPQPEQENTCCILKR